MEEIGKRIGIIAKHYSLSDSKFAQKIGLKTNVTISRIIRGESSPSFSILTKILSYFSEINTDWLIKGEGTMIGNTENEKPINQGVLSGKEALDIRMSLPYSIDDLAKKMNLGSSSTIYNNEAKDRVSNSYHQKLMSLVDQGSDHAKFKELYLKQLGANEVLLELLDKKEKDYTRAMENMQKKFQRLWNSVEEMKDELEEQGLNTGKALTHQEGPEGF